MLLEKSQERLSFTEMLPADINVYVTMHVDLDEYGSLTALKRFMLKYVKVLQNLMRKLGVHLVDDGGDRGSGGDGSVAGDGGDGTADDDFEARLAEIMNLEQLEPGGQAEICAFTKTRFQGRRPRAVRGPAGSFTGTAQGCGGFRAAGVALRPPPRHKNDVSCVNYGRKGYMAADCRQPKAEMGKRPCFNCNKPGHLRATLRGTAPRRRLPSRPSPTATSPRRLSLVACRLSTRTASQRSRADKATGGS